MSQQHLLSFSFWFIATLEVKSIITRQSDYTRSYCCPSMSIDQDLALLTCLYSLPNCRGAQWRNWKQPDIITTVCYSWCLPLLLVDGWLECRWRAARQRSSWAIAWCSGARLQRASGEWLSRATVLRADPTARKIDRWCHLHTTPNLTAFRMTLASLEAISWHFDSVGQMTAARLLLLWSCTCFAARYKLNLPTWRCTFCFRVKHSPNPALLSFLFVNYTKRGLLSLLFLLVRLCLEFVPVIRLRVGGLPNVLASA